MTHSQVLGLLKKFLRATETHTKADACVYISQLLRCTQQHLETVINASPELTGLLAKLEAKAEKANNKLKAKKRRGGGRFGKKKKKKKQKVMSDEQQLHIGEEEEVEKLMDMKVEDGITYYYVKWRGHGMDIASWEPEENLANCPGVLSDYRSSLGEQKQEQEQGEHASRVPLAPAPTLEPATDRRSSFLVSVTDDPTATKATTQWELNELFSKYTPAVLAQLKVYIVKNVDETDILAQFARLWGLDAPSVHSAFQQVDVLSQEYSSYTKQP